MFAKSGVKNPIITIISTISIIIIVVVIIILATIITIITTTKHYFRVIIFKFIIKIIMIIIDFKPNFDYNYYYLKFEYTLIK